MTNNKANRLNVKNRGIGGYFVPFLFCNLFKIISKFKKIIKEPSGCHPCFRISSPATRSNQAPAL